MLLIEGTRIEGKDTMRALTQVVTAWQIWCDLKIKYAGWTFCPWSWRRRTCIYFKQALLALKPESPEDRNGPNPKDA
jgi:hypothetical protein